MTSQINSIPAYPNLLDDLEILFYTSLSDAQDPTLINAIPTADLHTYMIPVGITEIWVRFHSKNSNCFEIKKLTLKKLRAPEIKTEVIPFRCSTDNELLEAVITIVPSKTNAQHSYSFDNGVTFSASKNTFTVHNEQTIKYVVIDDNGCSTAGTIDIPGYNPPTDMDIETIPMECNTTDDFPTITVKSITGPATDTVYTYEIINPVDAAPANTSGIFSGLLPNIYQIKATDNVTNCYIIKSVEVLDNRVVLKPQATIKYDCVNNTTVNFVTITVHETNTNPYDLDYAQDGSITYQQSNVFANIAPGVHTITVRHTEGCQERTLPFTIDEVKPLTLILTDGGLNEIVAKASGAYGQYRYSFNDEYYGLANNLIVYKSGIYTVSATDKYGCIATVSKYFEYIDLCIPNHFTPNGDGINDDWGPECAVNYKNLTFTVFDRYNRIIGNYKFGQKWNGKYNNTELPTGDYWYLIKLNDPKDDREFIGHFTLYR